MEHLRYTVLFQEEPEGGFTVTVPALPGCITYGKDLDEAREMALDAIGAYVASLAKDGESIPSDSEPFVASLTVKKPLRRGRALAHA